MEQNRNRIAAIVVTYNRYNLLVECMAALRDQSYRDFDILIIDNASTDGTGEKLIAKEEEWNFQYFNTGNNLGGAGGFNFGIRKAYDLGYEYYWIMDDDTIPESNALEELIAAKTMLHDKFGYLCSLALWTDGSICKMNETEKVECSKENEEYAQCGILPIKKATFVSFLVTRGTVEKVGLPIKEFFIWADDTNYCLRINKVAQGYLVSKSTVVHKMNSNTNANIVTDNGDRLGRYVYAFRNRFFNSRMENKLLQYYIYIGKRFCKILFLAKDHKKDRIKFMLEGVRQGANFKPEIEYVDTKKY